MKVSRSRPSLRPYRGTWDLTTTDGRRTRSPRGDEDQRDMPVRIGRPAAGFYWSRQYPGSEVTTAGVEQMRGRDEGSGDIDVRAGSGAG